MPELPEIETICRGLQSLIVGLTIEDVLVRETRLRVLIPAELTLFLKEKKIISVSRRAKYLIILFDKDCSLLIHLGMSGTLSYLCGPRYFDRHDHVDFIFTQGSLLRFRDPRRFGAIMYGSGDPLSHPALASLGPEPLTDEFNAEYLFAYSRRRKQAIKSFVMDQKIVVGIGNIYANEALYASGIAPCEPAGSINLSQFRCLVEEVRMVLLRAIAAGGTTLRDFASESGRPGYFSQELEVYGRSGQACHKCGGIIQYMRIAGRSSFYCPVCQL